MGAESGVSAYFLKANELVRPFKIAPAVDQFLPLLRCGWHLCLK
jgi:hypothetical protein